MILPVVRCWDSAWDRPGARPRALTAAGRQGITKQTRKDMRIIGVNTVNKCCEHYVFGSDRPAQFINGDGKKKLYRQEGELQGGHPPHPAPHSGLNYNKC